MNIVIPMAGEGRRFVEAGYKDPKPFIEVDRKPMIARVLETLPDNISNVILICREEHAKRARQLGANHVIVVDETTEGAACTVLQAKSFIDNNQPLIIANSDQLVSYNMVTFKTLCSLPSVDGAIFTFETALDPKWSYAKGYPWVTEVAEKDPISEWATCGLYYWARGRTFCNAAREMIIEEDRVNGEYYVCPTYNYALRAGARIRNFPVWKMHGLGTPEDLDAYLNSTSR